MVRFSLCAVLLITCSVSAAAQGDGGSVEENWKNLIQQGTELAVDAHDNAKAEQVFIKALREAERFGTSDVRVGATANRLGMVLKEEKKYGEAETAFHKALSIFEDIYGSDSIDVANINYNLGSLLLDQGKAPQSMSFLQKSLTVYRRQFGDTGLKTADVMCQIGDAYRLQRAWHDAEEPLKQCAHVREADSGLLSAPFGEAENSLAMVYQKEGKYGLADAAFKMAEKNRERNLGITSPLLAETLEAHATMLKEMGRDLEAEKNLKIANSIRKLQSRTK
jgi:tetratricopeptide (TPR) repeat protein